MSRYLLSPCCNALVVVPAEVTAHLLVKSDGTISKSIADTLRGIRLQALGMGVDIAEAYCTECGREVQVRAEEAKT